MIQKFWVGTRIPGANDVSKAGIGIDLGRIEKIIKESIENNKIKPVRQCRIAYFWHEWAFTRKKCEISSGKTIVNDALAKFGVIKTNGWDEVICFNDHFARAKSEEGVGVMVIIDDCAGIVTDEKPHLDERYFLS